MSSAEASPSYSFSLSRFALTLERAFQYSESDTIFSKLGKFTVGTALTTTACIAAIVETALASSVAILTIPLYPIVPKSYGKITQYTLDSAIRIFAAAKRTFGAEIKPAEPLVAAAVKHPTPAPAPPAPRTLQPEKVEKLLAPSQNFASRALQFSKEHKTLMVVLALGTATLATAFFLYYLKMTSPSNSLILPPPHSATLPSAVSSSAISSATSISAVSSSAISSATSISAVSSSAISSATSTSAVSSSAISSAASTSAVSLTHPTRTSIANTFSTTIATLTKQLTTNSTISRPIASIPTQATNHILSSSTKLILCLSVGMIIYVLMRSRRNRKDQDAETSSARTMEHAKKKKKRADEGLESLRNAAAGVSFPLAPPPLPMRSASSAGKDLAAGEVAEKKETDEPLSNDEQARIKKTEKRKRYQANLRARRLAERTEKSSAVERGDISDGPPVEGSSRAAGASPGRSAGLRAIIERSRAKAARLKQKSDHRPFNVRHGIKDSVSTPNSPQLGGDPSGGRGNSFRALADLVEGDDDLTDALGRLAPEGSGEETAFPSGDPLEESGSEGGSNEFDDLASLAAGVDIGRIPAGGLSEEDPRI